ncbi:DNA-directed RNA polymerase I subunit RPA49-like [Choloepus didactylus]|uniref:DNA-directed RNA polymerase I subunit RPA49-like n=1 Tax=Choloepus didactylus TaxID=27675 RepID=UPI0018A10706|nr:DNA-directed RNA polymerase I subunit RPA49-like [Choloepus didactylus]
MGPQKADAVDVLLNAKWLYHGEHNESHGAVLVQFTSGNLQSPVNMRKSKVSTNPRKSHQWILAAETDRPSSVGNNLGTGALKCNILCRHFVGILNKLSGQVKVYDAELFNMQPLFADESVENEPASGNRIKTYREKMTPTTFLSAMLMQPGLKTFVNLKIFFPLWSTIAEIARPDAYGFWMSSSNFDLRK